MREVVKSFVALLVVAGICSTVFAEYPLRDASFENIALQEGQTADYEANGGGNYWVGAWNVWPARQPKNLFVKNPASTEALQPVGGDNYSLMTYEPGTSTGEPWNPESWQWGITEMPHNDDWDFSQCVANTVYTVEADVAILNTSSQFAVQLLVQGWLAPGGGGQESLALVTEADYPTLPVNTWQHISLSFSTATRPDLVGWIPQIQFSGDDAAFDNIVMIPEPATMLLLSLGGLLIRRRRVH
jgi:hypothetical protein